MIGEKCSKREKCGKATKKPGDAVTRHGPKKTEHADG